MMYTPKGAVATKQTPFDFDSQATVHIYSRITIDNGLPTKISKGAQVYKLARPDLAEHVEFPKKPTEILTEAEKAEFRASYSELESFQKRYRQLRPMRKSYFDSLDKIAKNIDRGLVLYKGRWMTNKEHKEYLQERRSRVLAEEARKKET